MSLDVTSEDTTPEDSRAGAWFDPTGGGSLSAAEVLAQAAGGQAVLLGETHDSACNHRWQMHVCAGLLAHRADIVIGFEMFPARLNPVLVDWVAGGAGRRGLCRTRRMGHGLGL